jgi:hypothetical protein
MAFSGVMDEAMSIRRQHDGQSVIDAMSIVIEHVSNKFY